MTGGLLRTVLFPLLLMLAPLVSAAAQSRSDGEYAFVNVSVIPMDRDRVLAGQTVLVRGDKITEIGPSSRVKVPATATRIDGAGKYLIPSLAEMHAHINPDPKQAGQNQRILSLYALTGVATIRGMLGAPHHLPLREQAARGGILSPIIYSSGPSLNGNSVPTPDSAIRAVAQQKAAGCDFLKIHPGIKREVFDSLAATA